MKFLTGLILFLGIIGLIGATIVIAQISPTSNWENDFNITVSPRCFSNGTLYEDYDYAIHASQTNYRATLLTGRCERIIEGTVFRTANVQGFIEANINQTINNTGFSFHPSPYRDNEISGRRSLTLS